MGTSRIRRWLRAAMVGSTTVMAMASSGCDVEPPDDDTVMRDARAVTHGAGSLDGTPRLASFGNLFALPPGLDASDPEVLRAQAVLAIHARLGFSFAAVGCDATVETDGQTRVSLALESCNLLLWSIDAELEAVARVEADVVVWELDITEMATGLRGLPPSRFFGPAELRAPLDPDLPMQWSTQAGFVIETPQGRRYDTLSSASWTTDADDCVDIELGARLLLEEREDEVDDRIGELVLSARDLRRCPGRCPESGRVELSFGTGQLLAWTHDGGGTITVQGPRGRTLEARLPCAEEP